MGVWFLSNFLGNFVGGYVAGTVERIERGEFINVLGGQADFFFAFAVATFIVTVLLFLTALAMAASGKLAHPLRVAVALAAILVMGLVLILE